MWWHSFSIMSRLARFLLTGGTAAAVEYSIFLFLNVFLSEKWIFVSQTVSFLAGFIVSFLLNKKWVFKSQAGAKGELVRYAILGAINLVLTNVLLVFLTGIGVVYWIAKIILMGMVAAWNYLIFQKLIFKK